MGELEQLLVLFVAAVILAAAARRVGAPYPVFLGDATSSARSEAYCRAVQAARRAALGMRAKHEIGDNGFHRTEEELDWLEMAADRNEQ